MLITFDGAVGIRTRANGTSIGTADLDTVQEVQILTANYNAEYGRSAGGQIRMITKSGGQDFHGPSMSISATTNWTRTAGPATGPGSRAKQAVSISSGIS